VYLWALLLLIHSLPCISASACHCCSNRLFLQVPWLQLPTLCVLSFSIRPVPADGDGEFVLDSITWPAPCSIAASGLWYDVDNEDEPEGMDAYLLAVTWSNWAGDAAAAPTGLEAKLTSFVTLQV
jgi:hypothetical protein